MTTENYVRQFTNLYTGPCWFGDSFLEKLKEMDDITAFTKPTETTHSIAELVSHIIYWRRSLINILEGKLYNHSVNEPQNWTANEELKTKGWQSLLKELDESQILIIKMLKSTDDKDLQKIYRDKSTIEDLVFGVMQHDIYHLGQIGMCGSMVKQKVNYSK